MVGPLNILFGAMAELDEKGSQSSVGPNRLDLQGLFQFGLGDPLVLNKNVSKP